VSLNDPRSPPHAPPRRPVCAPDRWPHPPAGHPAQAALRHDTS